MQEYLMTTLYVNSSSMSILYKEKTNEHLEWVILENIHTVETSRRTIQHILSFFLRIRSRNFIADVSLCSIAIYIFTFSKSCMMRGKTKVHSFRNIFFKMIQKIKDFLFFFTKLRLKTFHYLYNKDMSYNFHDKYPGIQDVEKIHKSRYYNAKY